MQTDGQHEKCAEIREPEMINYDFDRQNGNICQPTA